MRHSTDRAGFTMAEVMIAVAITSILAALAAQNYTGFMVKARRLEPMGAGTGLARAQQAFLAEHSRWGTSDLGYGLDAPVVEMIGQFQLVAPDPADSFIWMNFKTRVYDYAVFMQGGNMGGGVATWEVWVHGNQDDESAFEDYIVVGYQPGVPLHRTKSPYLFEDDLRDVWNWPIPADDGSS